MNLFLENNQLKDVSSGTVRLFLKGLLLVLSPLVVLILPLFFHLSPNPQLGSYSLSYFLCILTILGCAIIAAIAIGHYCFKERSIKSAFWVLLLVLSLIFILILSEFLLQFKFRDPFAKYAAYGHQKSILFGVEAKPNNRWKSRNALCTTDGHGFRTHVSDALWDQRDGIRLFTLGGSSTFGYGLNDDETWSHLLENELRNSSKRQDIQVINAGNNGHNSLQTILRFYLKVLPFKPRYAIYYEPVNDIRPWKLSPESLLITEDILFSGSMYDYLKKIHPGENIYAQSLFAYTLQEAWKWKISPRGVHFLPKNKSDRVAYRAEGLSADEQEALRSNAKRYAKNIYTLIKLTQAYHVKLILITSIHDDERIGFFYSHSIKLHNRFLRKIAKKENVFLVDLEQQFDSVADKEEYFFGDRYHPTAKGARYIATVVSKAINNIAT